jgi:hypothetical protein
MSPLEIVLLRGFIWIALAGYVAAWGYRWRENMASFRAWWTLACVAYLAHVVVAFHAFHHWSHEHAVAHTQEQSGFGQGVWVSYLFTLLWPLNVVALWTMPSRRLPVWLERTWHGFMAFLLFNGAVVFAHGASFVFGVLAFGMLAVLAWRHGIRGANL